MLAHFLRGCALVIAAAGVADPVISLERAVPQSVTISIVDGPELESGTAASTRRDVAHRSAERLRRLLSSDFDARIRIVAADARASACRENTRCVLVLGGHLPISAVAASSRLVGILRVDEPSPPGPEIAEVRAPSNQDLRAAGELQITLASIDPAAGSRLQVFDGQALVGEREVVADNTASQTAGAVTAPRSLPAPGPPQRFSSADVSWLPVGAGVRRLRVHLAAPEGGQDRGPDAEVGVHVDSRVSDVLIYDTRPSWGSTFLRRALDGDPRFRVRFRSRLGPQLAVAGGRPFTLSADALEEVSIVVVGAPDGLTTQEVDLLTRYVRERGGSLLLVPDRRVTGSASSFLPPGVRERLEPKPVAIGALRAGELLIFPSLPPSARAIASTEEGTPVVVAVATGAGRILISGAMDSWRYREDESAFDRFWQSVSAESARLAGLPIEITARPLARVGDEVTVHVQRRSMTPGSPLDVYGAFMCAGGPERPLRLWPSSGGLTGVFTPARAGTCSVRVSLDAAGKAAAVTDVLVADDLRTLPSAAESMMQRLATFHGAPVVSAGEEEQLADAVTTRLGSQARSFVPMRVMHSPWWIVPFAACLGGEWWLRRRQGLR